MRALEDAGREVVGPHFSAAGIDFAGSLDPVIIARMLHAAGADPSPDAVASIRRRYPPHLLRHLALRPTAPTGTEPSQRDHTYGERTSGALPGVHPLLARLTSDRPHFTRGLLTGNFEEGARLKLAHCGIDHDSFSIRVYGDDSPHPAPRRDHLPPVAIERHARITGRAIPASRVLIIGDTTHDIGCARAHGARSLGVTTGGHTRAQLEAAGADRVLDSLEDTDDVVKWMDAIDQQSR